MNHIPLPSRALPTRTSSFLITLLVTVSMVIVSAPPAHAAPVVATPTIVPFTDWAPAACPAPTGADAAPVKRLVVHHTHEPVAHTPADVLPALALTCKAHTDRGFSTIGYHYVVDPWGTIYQGRGGLPNADGTAPATQGQGAHVAGTNAGAVGVVFLGDHEDEPPSTAALEAATQLLAWLLEPTGKTPNGDVPVNSTGIGTARHTGAFNAKAVSGHSDTNHTECPGEHLRALLPQLNERVGQVLAGKAPGSWDGLAADRPAEAAKPAPGKNKKAANDAAGKNKKPADAAAGKAKDAAAKAEDAAAKPDAAPDREVVATPIAVGPLASPAEVLARGLRSVGLLSLAERIAPTFQTP